jgi:hypothetical protein
MNIHLKQLSFRKYSFTLIYSLLFIAVIIWTLEFYFERLYGDLTRTGNFSERDFGWRAEQPAVPSEYFKTYSLAEADIVVIGDSFSVGRVWQTRLIADGLKVCTLIWSDLKIGDSMPINLAEALRGSGFKGRYVFLESVERVFQRRVQSLMQVNYPIVKKDIAINPAFQLYPFMQRERISLDKPNGGKWGMTALYNKIKLALNLPEKYLKSGWTQPIKFDGCQFFSHRLCNYALFIKSDFQKETFNSIDNVLKINKNLQQADMQPIWLIIPDKATVYLGYGKLNQYPYQNIWQLFSKYPELTAPDLATEFIAKSRTIKDFYMPNDTHLSTNGSLYLGDFITKELRNIQANQSKAFSQ